MENAAEIAQLFHNIIKRERKEIWNAFLMTFWKTIKVELAESFLEMKIGVVEKDVGFGAVASSQQNNW